MQLGFVSAILADLTLEEDSSMELSLPQGKQTRVSARSSELPARRQQSPVDPRPRPCDQEISGTTWRALWSGT